MSVLKLTITNFDSLENSVAQAEFVSEEKLFADDNEHTAHAKCSDYIKSKNYKLHLGWNSEVYPKFEVKRVYVE